ncbi:MAG: hypothetical protein AAB646_02930 [Patescibacteria group bacterium]
MGNLIGHTSFILFNKSGVHIGWSIPVASEKEFLNEETITLDRFSDALKIMLSLRTEGRMRLFKRTLTAILMAAMDRSAGQADGGHYSLLFARNIDFARQQIYDAIRELGLDTRQHVKDNQIIRPGPESL